MCIFSQLKNSFLVHLNKGTEVLRLTMTPSMSCAVTNAVKSILVILCVSFTGVLISP